MTNGALRRGIILATLVVVVLVASVAPLDRPISGGLGSSPAGGPVASPSAGFRAPSTGTVTDVVVAPAFFPAPGVVTVGPEPPTSPVTVDVGLALSDPSALAGLVSAIYAPGTPEYHAFLTPSELAQRFGPSASSVSTAQAYFERFGLSVRTSPDRLLLTVTGPSAHVGAAFGTTFEEYRGADGRSFVSHPTAAALPPIAPWSGVYGLGNVTPLVPAVGPPTPLRAATPSVATNCGGLNMVLDACQVWAAYNMTSLISAGTNGSGFRVAVVDAYSSVEPQPLLETDLGAFEVRSELAPGTVNYLYPDPASGDLNSSANLPWGFEDALDIEWARAAAPGATVDMTFSPNAGPGLYEAVDWLVAHQAADVISMSWGEPDVGIYNAAVSLPCSSACNASTDGSYGILSPVLEFAAAEGISVFAASGDCGAADGTSGVSTNYPASDPDVTGVGGTVLTVNDTGAYVSEVAWSGNATGARSPGCDNQGGSGGGYSPFPRPGWQTGLPAGTSNRGVPDVALNAGSQAFVFFAGNPTSSSGTSLSTPIWAGIAAVADQYAGGRLGLLDPSLYAIASGSNYGKDFHDVLSGENGYGAGPGWDPITGLGSPQVATLVADLAHPAPVSSSDLASFVYATPRFGTAPLTVSFHVNATGGTGTYPLEGVSFGDGNASFAPAGVATYTYDRPGVYSVQAYVADSAANYSLSPPVAVVVGGGHALAVTLSASTAIPASGEPVLFSVGVTGGVAPYEYDFAFGDGTFLDNSSLSATSHVFGANGSFCAAVVVSDSASPVNGGANARVAVGVGGASLPDCRNDTVPLSMSPTPNPEVRDAPADFPSLFSVSGGSTAAGTLAPSLQFVSNDPYISACECTTFRAPGAYSVTGYANDSENEQATATTSVTVAPPLVGTFTANRTVGVAPLMVGFHAEATGGTGANATSTLWTFGNGEEAVGASVSTTYSAPGLYVAIGHLSDLGHGNASEAFLVDVVSAGGWSLPPPPLVTATITPAVDVPLGTTVNFTARALTESGSAISSVFRWSIGSGSGAYRPSLNWTYSSPSALAANGTFTAVVGVTDLTTNLTVNATIELLGFAAVEPGGFQPRVDALTYTDGGGPALGVVGPLWTGNAYVAAPGALSVTYAFGDGSNETVLTVIPPAHAGWFPATHVFFAGLFTVVVTPADSWGDTATDVLPVEVIGPPVVNATLSATSGAAPLTVTFRAYAVGGLGPPYLYVWRFGDSGVADAENTTHTFGSPGTYNVTLNVTDYAGDRAVVNWTVVVVAAAVGGFPSAELLGVGAVVGVGAALVAVASRRRPTGGGPIPIP
jgi:PKD repeat protein